MSLEQLCKCLGSRREAPPPSAFWQLLHHALQTEDEPSARRICRAFGVPESCVQQSVHVIESDSDEADEHEITTGETYRTKLDDNEYALFDVVSMNEDETRGMICWHYSPAQIARFKGVPIASALSKDLTLALYNGVKLTFSSNHTQEIDYKWVGNLGECLIVTDRVVRVTSMPAEASDDGIFYLAGHFDCETKQLRHNTNQSSLDRRGQILSNALLCCGSDSSPINRPTAEWGRAIERIQDWRFHELDSVETGRCAACGLVRTLTFGLQVTERSRTLLKLGRRCQRRLHFAYMLATTEYTDDLLDEAHECLAATRDS